MSREQSPSNFSLKKAGLLPQEEMLEITTKRKNLSIGIPREDQKNESRVALTPEAIEILVESGHEVIIERKAGEGANYSDTDYSECGGFIVDEKTEVYKCDIVLKIAPVTQADIKYLKGNQLIISALELNNQKRETIKALMDSKVTAIAFEYLMDDTGNYPVERSMDAISGNTSILIAAEYLSKMNNGKGVMLGGITGITPTEVVILGSGTAAEFATRAAIGLGAFVKIFDDSVSGLRRLQDVLGYRLYTSVFHPRVLSKAVCSADVIIGAKHYGNNTPRYYVTKEMVKKMKEGSVIVDISIDEGGCVETSECHDQNNPSYVKHGVIHYCVPNLPSIVSRTASIALSNIFLPLVMDISNSGGYKQHIRESKGLCNGVYIYNGILTNAQIGSRFTLPSQNIDLLMAAF